MKNKTKLLLILACIIILIIVASVIALLINKNCNSKNEIKETIFNNTQNVTNDYENSTIENNVQDENNTQAEDISDDSEFLTVQNILTKIISTINSKNPKVLINYLDTSFKNSAGITENNVLSLFDGDDFSYWYLLSMEKQKVNDNVSEFFLNVSDAKAIKNADYNENTDTIVFKVYLDSSNKTFSITLYKDEITDNVKSISKNEYNQFTYINSSDELLGKYYISLFKYLIKNNPKYAFEILSIDDTNSISTYEEFQSYIQNTNIDTEKITVTRTTENNNQVLQIVDSNNNHFKFKIYTYTNFTINLDNTDVDTADQKFSSILSVNNTAVSNSEITNFMDSFINSTVSKINAETSGLSDNKIREYYDEHTSEVNSMGIYNAEDFVNLSNQIVGMRWSKGARFMNAYVSGKTEENGYVKYNLKLSYTLNEEIDLYLCVAKSSNTTPQMKIETTGVPDNDDDTYTE